MKLLALVFGCATLIATAPAFSQTTSAAPPLHPAVLFKTSMGNITVELDPQAAPKTVANFLQYVSSGQYTGTVFHRVIPGFMIQGGGFDIDPKDPKDTKFYKLHEKSTRAPIPLESKNGLKNTIGTIAMARTSDPDSATAQFFINTADNQALDYPGNDGHGYAVFGKVTAGLDVVTKIEHVPTASRGGMENVPSTPVWIESASVVSK
jgi:peptidyl-prolyl cis-trans isomerase A (cyclophilin A)